MTNLKACPTTRERPFAATHPQQAADRQYPRVPLPEDVCALETRIGGVEVTATGVLHDPLVICAMAAAFRSACTVQETVLPQIDRNAESSAVASNCLIMKRVAPRLRPNVDPEGGFTGGVVEHDALHDRILA